VRSGSGTGLQEVRQVEPALLRLHSISTIFSSPSFQRRQALHGISARRETELSRELFQRGGERGEAYAIAAAYAL